MSYTVIRPGNHYASRLPAFGDAPVVKLVTPRLAPARLGEYLVALPAGGGTVRPVAPGFETFVYALEGTATLSGDVPLGAGAWAYLPARDAWSVEAGDAPARLLVVKRRHEYAPGFDVPPARNGHRDDVAVGGDGRAGLPPPRAAPRRRPELRLRDVAARLRSRASASRSPRSTTRSTGST